MKIGHPPPPPSLQRELPPGKTSRSGGDAAPSGTTVTLSDAAQAASSADGAPAGLLKVQARLQDLGDTRTRGQSVALERISRNIARYLENQAPAPVSAPAPAPVDTPPTEPVADVPVTEPTAPTDTPTAAAESPAESPAASPAEAPAPAAAGPVAELPVDNTQALLDALEKAPDTSA